MELWPIQPLWGSPAASLLPDGRSKLQGLSYIKHWKVFSIWSGTAISLCCHPLRHLGTPAVEIPGQVHWLWWHTCGILWSMEPAFGCTLGPIWTVALWSCLSSIWLTIQKQPLPFLLSQRGFGGGSQSQTGFGGGVPLCSKALKANHGFLCPILLLQPHIPGLPKREGT